MQCARWPSVPRRRCCSTRSGRTAHWLHRQARRRPPAATAGPPMNGRADREEEAAAAPRRALRCCWRRCTPLRCLKTHRAWRATCNDRETSSDCLAARLGQIDTHRRGRPVVRAQDHDDASAFVPPPPKSPRRAAPTGRNAIRQRPATYWRHPAARPLPASLALDCRYSTVAVMV